jgi:hypothetical protein
MEFRTYMLFTKLKYDDNRVDCLLNGLTLAALLFKLTNSNNKDNSFVATVLIFMLTLYCRKQKSDLDLHRE